VKRNRVNCRMIVSAAGTCLALASAAQAQPQLINVSGATLLQNFVSAPASTNDFIDVNGDGIPGVNGAGPQQLAVANIPGPYAPTHIWTVQYRIVGSVNGFNELVSFGAPFFVTSNASDTNGLLGGVPGTAVTTAVNNRVGYIANGAATGSHNLNNPGGAPNVAATAGANRAVSVGPAAPGGPGITIDIAPLDVACEWATRKGTDFLNALPVRTPFQAGYGQNPRLSVGKNGDPTFNPLNPQGGGLSSRLAGLGTRNLFDPANPGLADSNTIFSTELFYAPLAPVTNFGTGVTQMTMTELQHLFVSGRTVTGENLIAMTRDVGSGTRNAFMNCIGIDPSWGVGDNVGLESAATNQFNLGANFLPTNKASNGGMESSLRNARLAIGYVGTERGVTGSGSGSWLTQGGGAALDIVNVRNDIYGGVNFVRPTINNLLDNSSNGWVIGGQAVLATIGDPLAEPVAQGGENNGRPAMVNKAAAAYINNVRRSIAAFVAIPGGAQSDFAPGELAAQQFILLAAIDNLHPLTAPATLVANPGLVQTLQDYTRTNNVHTNAVFSASITTSSGRVPTRSTGPVYSDGVAGGANYLSQGTTGLNGVAVTYGAALTNRNKIAFDFNGDLQRTTADAADMISAWRQRNGGPAWVAPTGVAGAGSDAVIEILGDADGNGSFNRDDVRYWADGLARATATGNIDRKLGFTSVDTAFAGNFFGTTLATSKPYAAGDARGDVIGTSGNVARGWAPVGADGAVDCNDIEYVYAQFKKNAAITDGAANWSSLTEAANFDLSADMNGDLKVDQDDVTEVIQTILGTVYGDVNFDGVRNAADSDLITANFNTLPATYCRGDVNGDGVINASDIGFTPGPSCRIDFNNNGTREPADIFAFLTAYFAPSTPVAQIDFNCNTTREPADIFAFLTKYFANDCAGCP
jgi:hypothetical protein